VDGAGSERVRIDGAGSERVRIGVMSWHDSWTVQTDEYTRFVDTTFDGTSADPAARSTPVTLTGDAPPEDFSIGVVLGPRGSGKSQFLKELRDRLGSVHTAEMEEFGRRTAVCSLPGLGGAAIDRLGAVGLNKIPSWLRPYGALSNGEQTRVVLALTVGTDAVLDDFAAVTDEQTATSTAAAIRRYVAQRGLRRILVGTTKACVVRFLQPDFVIFATSGRLRLNPWPKEERKPKVAFDWKVTFEDRSWVGEPDEGPLAVQKSEQGKLRELPEAAIPRSLDVQVDVDTTCDEVSAAFEYEFHGSTTTTVYSIRDVSTKPFSTFGLAAIVGPSGCGKSTELRRWDPACDEAVTWDSDLAVVSHFGSEGVELERASRLLEAVALPRAVWLRPFRVLSSGEKALAEVARKLCRGGAIDEFTSTLDRTTGQRVCEGVARYVREFGTPRPVIVATIHEDVVEWLLPDWAFWPQTGRVVAKEAEAHSPPAEEEEQMRPALCPGDRVKLSGLKEDTHLNGMCGHLQNFEAGLFGRCKVRLEESGEVKCMAAANLQIMPAVPVAQNCRHWRVGKLSRCLQRHESQCDGADEAEVKSLLQPPSIVLTARKLDGFSKLTEAWDNLFHAHHYLTSSLSRNAHAIIVRCGKTPVALHAVAVLPGAYTSNITFLEHRLVVLPEWQGLGIGPRLSVEAGKRLISGGARFFATTAHPRLAASRRSTPALWKEQPNSGKPRSGNFASGLRAKTSEKAKTAEKAKTSEKAKSDPPVELDRSKLCGGCEHALARKRGRRPGCTCGCRDDVCAVLGQRQSDQGGMQQQQQQPHEATRTSGKEGKARIAWNFQFLGPEGHGNDHLVAHLKKSASPGQGIAHLVAHLKRKRSGGEEEEEEETPVKARTSGMSSEESTDKAARAEQ
jgi:ABC-type iron transport system FetAB ATPase subunit/GNAT superfamily N-acetyltransferase